MGKVNNILVERLDRGGILTRVNRNCMDNVFMLNELIQGRLRENKHTYAFFLQVQKAYDTVWRDGLWLKLWDLGVKGRMWCVSKEMYAVSRSAVLLEGEKSNMFSLEQGVVQGCSVSPISQRGNSPFVYRDGTGWPASPQSPDSP